MPIFLNQLRDSSHHYCLIFALIQLQSCFNDDYSHVYVLYFQSQSLLMLYFAYILWTPRRSECIQMSLPLSRGLMLWWVVVSSSVQIWHTNQDLLFYIIRTLLLYQLINLSVDFRMTWCMTVVFNKGTSLHYFSHACVHGPQVGRTRLIFLGDTLPSFMLFGKMSHDLFDLVVIWLFLMCGHLNLTDRPTVILTPDTSVIWYINFQYCKICSILIICDHAVLLRYCFGQYRDDDSLILMHVNDCMVCRALYNLRCVSTINTYDELKLLLCVFKWTIKFSVHIIISL